MMFPAFFNPRWLRLIRGVAEDRHADLILCRDLPLAPAAIFVGRRLRIPVVLDMAENYPAMIRSVWDHGLQGPLDWALRNPKLVEAVERWVVARVDHVIVVVEESARRLEKMGVCGKDLTVVVNTPLRSRIPARPISASNDETLDLVYLGLLEKPRGIDVVLDAVATCRNRSIPVRLLLIGDGRDIPGFRRRAADLGLEDGVVRFAGYVPYEQALDRLARADVGLVPHHPNESWNSTIPNKLFDYMALGLPVITSDAKPAARVVRETGCGVVYPGTSAEALSEAIQRLSDRNTRKQLGVAGYRAVQRRYNWDVDGNRLVECLEAVVESERL